jgi:hypothetical protein
MLAEMEMTRTMNNTGTVFLDPDQKSPRAQDFEERLTSRIVGQERAVRRMSGLYQIFLAGMNPPNRPIGTMLFLGPKPPLKFSTETPTRSSKSIALSFNIHTK